MHLWCPGSGAPSAPCGCSQVLARVCLHVPPYQAAFQRDYSLFGWGGSGTGKEDLFVSSSDDGKDIRLHPLLGVASRLIKNSFSQEEEGCWERCKCRTVLKLGTLCLGHSSGEGHRGDGYPCMPFWPLHLIQNASH